MIELSANVQVNLSTTDRDAIASPLAGMVIYNTTDDRIQYFDGLTWIDLAEGNAVEAGLTFKGVTKTEVGEGIYVLDALDPADFVLPAATGSGKRYLFAIINASQPVLASPYIVGGDTAVNGTDIIVPVNTTASSILNNIDFESLSNLNDMILVSEYTYTSGSRPKAIVEDDLGSVIGSWDILEDNNVNVTGNPSVDGVNRTYILKVTTYNDVLTVKTNTANLFQTGGNEPTVEFQLTTTPSSGERVKISGNGTDTFNNDGVTTTYYNNSVNYFTDAITGKYSLLQDYKEPLDLHTLEVNPHNTNIVNLEGVPDQYGTAGQVLQVNINTTALEWGNAGAGISKFRDLTDTPIGYGTTGQILVMDATQTALEWSNPVSGITTLLGLSDTPGSFNAFGSTLAVNAGGTALEWIAPHTPVTTVLELTDTPNDFTSSTIGDVLTVNSAKNAFEYSAPGASVITGLLDVPDDFGTPGQVLTVNAATDAAIWTTIAGGSSSTLISLTDTPVSLGTTGQVLQVDVAGTATEWVTPSGGGSSTLVSLTDTPAGLGTVGQVLAVNSGTSAVEWVNQSATGVTTLTGLTDTPASLGTAGQVLKVNAAGNNTEWATLTGGGGGIASTDTIEAGMYMYISGSTPVNTRVALQIMSYDTVFPIAIPDSRLYAGVPPSGGDVTLTIKKELFNNYGTAVTIGTVQFVDGNANGIVVFSNQEVLSKGDMIYLESPSSTNSMADVFIYLRGYSEIPLYI